MHAPLTRRLTPGYPLPHDLEKLKLHLKVEHSEEDAYISGLAIVASSLWEAHTGQAVMQAEYVSVLPKWSPMFSGLRGPITAITKVEYPDEYGVLQTLPSGLYSPSVLYADTLVFAAYYDLPALHIGRQPQESVRVTYTAGAATPDEVPPIVQQFMRLMVGHWYENRQEVVPGLQVAQIPMGAQSLIDLERVPVL